MGKLCDVTLLAGDVEILAHRAVLASCSPYFYAMFTAEMAESKAKKVTLQQIDPAALSMLIDFVYTSEIHVTEDNVQVCYIHRPSTLLDHVYVLNPYRQKHMLYLIFQYKILSYLPNPSAQAGYDTRSIFLSGV